MKYLPKTNYWRHLVPNVESVDKTTNPNFKTCAPSVTEDELWFVLLNNQFSIFSSIHAFTVTYKRMEKFEREILKCTRTGKSDAEEASCIEGCVNPKIQ